MTTYTVRRGDTLSSIAARNHVSLQQLEAANRQIHNPNNIYVGEHIAIPGHAAAHHPAPAHHAPAHHAPTKTGHTTKDTGHFSGHTQKAYDVAKQYLGHNIQQLKYSGTLARYLDKWPSSHVCCANFVSACLEKAGLIRHSEHNDSVRGLANNLRHDPHFRQVSLRNAKPGDVVCFHVPGEGDYAHTVLFAGWRNGQPIFIGSNNVNADGSQRITMGHMGYSINAIFQHV